MISKKVFSADGVISRFLSDFIIRSEQFARPYVYIYDNTLAVDGSEDKLVDGSIDQADWSWPDNIWKRGANNPQSNDTVTEDKWQIVDNSVLYYLPPIATSTVWIEVATTSEEFGDTLTAASVEKAEEAALAAAGSADDAAISAASVEASSVQIETNRLDIVGLDVRVTDNETDIVLKANSADVYTKVELDAGQLDNRYYTETEVDVIEAGLQTYATDNDIGVGQTWTDVFASRVKTTVYTNSTGKPIQIKITGSAGQLELYVDSLWVDTDNGLSGSATTVDAIVPNGSTYYASGIAALVRWHELR